MLVEVEGINSVGKSSLVALLAARGMNTHKFQRPDNPVQMMYSTHIRLAEHSQVWVIDRGHGTEWAMSRALRRAIPYTQLSYWALDEDFARNDTQVVYLDAPKEVIEERMARVGRQWEAPYDLLVEAWETFLAKTLCRVVRLDATQPLEALTKAFDRQVLPILGNENVT